MQFSALAASLLVLATLASASTECQWGPLYWCQSQEKAEICGKLEYCQESSWKEPADESGTLCVICEALLSLVHNYLEKNITSGELELVLDEFCTYLDVEVLINECQHIVNEYFPKIWKLLEDGTNPKTICPMFFSDCPKSEPTEKATSFDPICKACVITGLEMQRYVERKQTEGEVKAAVEEACKEYPRLKKQCQEDLQNWTKTWDEVLYWLIHHVELCGELGFCDAGIGRALQVDDLMKVFGLNSLRTAATRLEPMADALCTFCVDLAEYLYNWTLNDTVEDIFHQAVIELCAQAPEKECKKALEDFPKYWKEEVQDRLHNGKECYIYEFENTTICKGKPPVPQIRARKEALLPPSNDAICEACLITARELHKYVERSQTEEEVKAAIEEVCREYPEVEEACKTVLQNWTKSWNKVKHDVDSRLCNELGICEGGSDQPLQIDDVMDVLRLRTLKTAATQLEPMADAVCKLCLDLAEYLYNWTLNDTVRDVYHQAVIEVCKQEPEEEPCKRALADFPKYWKEEVQDRLHNGKECYASAMVCSGPPPAPHIRQRKEVSLSSSKEAFCKACNATSQKLYNFCRGREEEARAAYEKYCLEYPEHFAHCETILVRWKDNWNEFVNTLRTNDSCGCGSWPPQVNVVMEMMKPLLLKRSGIQTKPMADPLCRLCVELAKYLYNWTLNDTVKEMFHQGVINGCEQGLIEEQICKIALPDFFKFWKEEVQDRLHNGKECYTFQNIMICKGQPPVPEIRQRKEDITHNSWVIEPPKAPISIPRSISLSIKQAPSPPSNDSLCEACMITSRELHKFVLQKGKEKEVLAALMNLCVRFPDFYTYCGMFLRNWTNTWEELKHDLYNYYFCYFEDVCENESSQSQQVNVVMEMMRLIQLKESETEVMPISGALCRLCVDLADYLYNWTFNDAVREVFQQAVIEECKEKHIEEQICKKAEANFSTFWKEDIQEVLHNGKACYMMHNMTCKEQLPVEQIRTRKKAPLPPANDAICEACLITAAEMERFVNRSKTENEVKAAVEEVCKDYPELQEYCQEVLKNWTKTWDEVKRDLSKSHVCYEEGVCERRPGQPLQVNVVMKIMRLQQLKASETQLKPMADALCTFCVDLAEYLYNWTLNDTVRDIFHKAVIEECKKEPAEPQCKKALADFPKYWKEEVQDKLHNGKECYGYEEVCGGQLPVPQIKQRKKLMKAIYAGGF